MKKILAALLITGLFSTAPLAATERYSKHHHNKHRKHRDTIEVVDDCPQYPRRPWYFGLDIGYAETKFKPPRAYVKALALNARIGYMDNIDYFLYGIEGGVGIAPGKKSQNFVLAETFLNTDLVVKLGVKIDRAATYGLVGPGFATFRVANVPGKSSSKFQYETLLGFGIMYDMTRRFALKLEYRNGTYRAIRLKAPDSTPSSTSATRVKLRTNFTLLGFLYRL